MKEPGIYEHAIIGEIKGFRSTSTYVREGEARRHVERRDLRGGPPTLLASHLDE
jgi:hypothetical protein